MTDPRKAKLDALKAQTEALKQKNDSQKTDQERINQQFADDMKAREEEKKEKLISVRQKCTDRKEN